MRERKKKGGEESQNKIQKSDRCFRKIKKKKKKSCIKTIIWNNKTSFSHVFIDKETSLKKFFFLLFWFDKFFILICITTIIIKHFAMLSSRLISAYHPFSLLFLFSEPDNCICVSKETVRSSFYDVTERRMEQVDCAYKK